MRKMFLVLSTLLAFISALTFNSLANAGHHEKGEMTPETVGGVSDRRRSNIDTCDCSKGCRVG